MASRINRLLDGIDGARGWIGLAAAIGAYAFIAGVCLFCIVQCAMGRA